MNEIKLEELAKRLDELEKKVAKLAPSRPENPDIIPATGDWRDVIGFFAGSEFMAQVNAEVLAMREAERQAARAGLDP